MPTADRLVLALGALVVVLAGASSDDPSSVGEPRDLDWLAVGLLVAHAEEEQCRGGASYVV